MSVPVALAVAGLAILILAWPAIARDRKPRRLVGPRLAELDYTEVSFTNGGLSLAGMLFVPAGEGPFPAAVIIHGSGTSRRDNRWYLSIVKHLQDNGVAVLLPDKRGSEQSQGDWRQASFADLAGDALAAVTFLRTHKPFRYSGIGLIGMSQGGWIAPLATATDPSISFVVSVVGSAVTTDEQVLYEEIYNIADAGTYLCLARLLAPLTVRFIITRRPFWKHIGGFDPLPYWRRLTIPAFAAFGEGDRNVPVDESVRRLRSLDNALVSTRVYPQGGHAIIDRETYRVQGAFLDDVAAFVKRWGR